MGEIWGRSRGDLGEATLHSMQSLQVRGYTLTLTLSLTLTLTLTLSTPLLQGRVAECFASTLAGKLWGRYRGDIGEI